ncbi:hypothetical protein [Cupriavidus sp. CP313]
MPAIRRLPIVVSAIAWAPAAFAAAGTPAAEHDHSHSNAPATASQPATVPSAAATPAKGSNTQRDAQVAHLRAIRERLSRATTAEERQSLMAERQKVMREAMASMQKDMMSMTSRARQPSASTGTADQMQVCRDMMGQHMALMQEMIHSMDGSGTSGMGRSMMRHGMVGGGDTAGASPHK